MNQRNYIYLATCYLLLATLISGCATVAEVPPSKAISQRYVRVAVINGAKQLTLSIPGQSRILALHTGETLKEAENLKKTLVKATHSGFIFGDEPIMVFGARIEAKGSNIYIDKLALRGSVELLRQQDLTILVINHIEIEEYLKGVLYHESSRYWKRGVSFEALKALAIAARTYALYQDVINIEKDFGLTADVYSQVYGGRLSERRYTDKAVNATSGQVLTYKGRIFPAYHHSCCGGHTEDAARVWDVDTPPLKGVVCDFCKDSPHYRWQRVVPMNSIGSNLKEIEKITINNRDASGRVISVTIEGDEGSSEIEAKNLRKLIGFNVLKSTNFDVYIKDGFAYFKGQGWGHGVGLCQWGAYGMAKEGYIASQILAYYYPGSVIKEVK